MQCWSIYNKTSVKDIQASTRNQRMIQIEKNLHRSNVPLTTDLVINPRQTLGNSNV